MSAAQHGQILMGDDPPWLQRNFLIPNKYDHDATAMGPQIRAAHYKIKASVINILSTKLSKFRLTKESNYIIEGFVRNDLINIS